MGGVIDQFFTIPPSHRAIGSCEDGYVSGSKGYSPSGQGLQEYVRLVPNKSSRRIQSFCKNRTRATTQGKPSYTHPVSHRAGRTGMMT